METGGGGRGCGALGRSTAPMGGGAPGASGARSLKRRPELGARRAARKPSERRGSQPGAKQQQDGRLSPGSPSTEEATSTRMDACPGALLEAAG